MAERTRSRNKSRSTSTKADIIAAINLPCGVSFVLIHQFLQPIQIFVQVKKTGSASDSLKLIQHIGHSPVADAVRRLR